MTDAELAYSEVERKVQTILKKKGLIATGSALAIYVDIYLQGRLDHINELIELTKELAKP